MSVSFFSSRDARILASAQNGAQSELLVKAYLPCKTPESLVDTASTVSWVNRLGFFFLVTPRFKKRGGIFVAGKWSCRSNMTFKALATADTSTRQPSRSLDSTPRPSRSQIWSMQLNMAKSTRTCRDVKNNS